MVSLKFYHCHVYNGMINYLEKSILDSDIWDLEREFGQIAMYFLKFIEHENLYDFNHTPAMFSMGVAYRN